MSTDSLPRPLEWAVEAAQNKKALGIAALHLAPLGAFTEAFLICSGSSSRQVQAISDEIEEQLGRRGVRPGHREGYETGEWVLLDYGDFIIHVFNERARLYYDLERLWRSARRTDFPEASEGVAR